VAQQQKEAEQRQQQQNKEQARQQKELEKQQEKQQKLQQKEQAKQQKEMQKLQQKQAKNAANYPSTGSVASDRASHNDLSASKPGNVIEDSRNVVDRLNSNRSAMSGINRRPIPSGDVTTHPNGSLTVKDSLGRQYNVRANGTISSLLGDGKVANFSGHGRITSIHTANMDIRHRANGQRIVVAHRADNVTVVATSKKTGYIERSIVRDNRTYLQQTVIANSRIVTRTYVTYPFMNVALPHFVTPVFYSPAFYGWAFHPWLTPVPYSWVWFGAPWYAGPAPYFIATPVYPNASFWLTDYALGQTLAAGYEAQQEALADRDGGDASLDDGSNSDDTGDRDDSSAPRASVQTPITPELKVAIAEEVQRQIAADYTASANPDKAASYAELPSALAQPNHVFVVANTIDVTTADQQECQLQSGDVLRLTTAPSTDSPLAQLRVASGRIMDCPAGIEVMVSVQDLQDMQNNLREQIASGLEMLRENQGTNGLPAAPGEALLIPPQGPGSNLAPLSSADAFSMLETETHNADSLELDVTHRELDGQTAQIHE